MMESEEQRIEGLLAKLQRRFAEAVAPSAPPTPRAGASAPPPDVERVAPMQRTRRHWVVVSYDIPDDRRRTRVMKTLEGYGHRVQYSVFECELRPADLDRLKARLKVLIQKEEDDIRFYDLCENCQAKVTMLGRAKMYREKGSVVV